MSSAPLVTVGVTSYNDDQGISRCLESLAQQSLGAEQIEVILVDDGSADGTVEKARAWAEGEAPWAAFHLHEQENTGTPSTGRNTILREAAGRYTFFVDADDYLGQNALQAMTDSAQEHRSDIVVGRYQGVERSAPNVIGTESREAAHEYHAGWLNSLHVQKLFRTEFIRSLDYRFNERLIYASDHPFMISAFLHAETVSFVNDVDCYFITLEQKSSRPEEPHVSRATVSPLDQLRFLHDCFGILALGRGRGGAHAALSGKMRADYWNRLLKLHIPVLLLRRKMEKNIAAIASEALYIGQMYGAETMRTSLAPEAQLMLRTLETGDAATISGVARLIRRGPAKG